MTMPTAAEHEALRLADDLDAMGRSKDMGRPAIQDIERRAAAMLRALAAPHATTEHPDWWRRRADEIEAQVARTGSREAMSCYTQMRSLLQASASPAAPAPCAMVGLTHEEAVDVLRFGSSSKAMADAITRAFCQKNNVELKDQP